MSESTQVLALEGEEPKAWTAMEATSPIASRTHQGPAELGHPLDAAASSCQSGCHATGPHWAPAKCTVLGLMPQEDRGSAGCLGEW